MAEFNKKPAGRSRGGYAMIILLVIIGLGVLLFILQKAGVFNPRPKDPNAPGIMPWDEWKARQMLRDEGQGEPAEQPDVKSLEFDGNLREPGAGKPRGELRLFISPRGVSGGWTGAYHTGPEKMYDSISSGFSGEFHPDKKYTDEDGNEDPSKLYFLCGGEFQMQETGKQVVRVLVGEIYVRGWLDKNDNKLYGSIFITSNHKDYKEFEFKGLAREVLNIWDAVEPGEQ
jgi:hypothetical protein